MSLPVGRILWAPSNSAHYDHLHVEGDPHLHGEIPNDCSSVWTPAIQVIWAALEERFGEGHHFQVEPDADWTHMGIYNCRTIANSDTPSQHAFSNAIDIGPYYGVEEQQVFYDFLTGKEEMTPEEVRQIIREELNAALGPVIAFTDLDDKQRITRRSMLDVMSAAHGGLTLKEGIARGATSGQADVDEDAIADSVLSQINLKQA